MPDSGVWRARGAVATVLAGAGVASGGCMSWLHYGDLPAKSSQSVPTTPEQDAKIRAMWIAGAQEAAQQCEATIDSLVRGAVFVAEGERSPRAKELLARECGPFTKEEREHFDDPAVAKPLADANPALCRRLQSSPPLPEAFALRYEGSTLYWYYFTYEDVGGRLRTIDPYSKVQVTLPAQHADCALAIGDVDDLGLAPMWHRRGQPMWGPVLQTFDYTTHTYHPGVVILPLVHTYNLPFRRSAKPLEVPPDAG